VLSESTQNAESLSEIEGDTLQLYGSRSLDAFDRSWGFQAAGCVNTVHFHYVDFDDVAKVLPKIRVRFPNVVVGFMQPSHGRPHYALHPADGLV